MRETAMGIDLRITPVRPGLAAQHLAGEVESERYSEGVARQIVVGAAPLRASADAGSRLDTELLFGELFTVYDIKEFWAWGQAGHDSYVGYVPVEALGPVGGAPTHRIGALASHLYAEPEIKAPIVTRLSLAARVRVVSGGSRFAEIEHAGQHAYVPLKHLAPIASYTDDYAGAAERFVGVPYLWGGRTSAGADCSGLVQTALAQAGIVAPRDSDQQCAWSGANGTGVSPSEMTRGDLIFWGGHVAIAVDAARIVHANGSAMAVSIDVLGEFAARVEAADGPILAIHRLRR